MASDLLQEARRLRQLGEYDSALQILDSGLIDEPASAVLLPERVAILLLAGRENEASLAIDALAEVYPVHPNLRLLRGQLAEALGDAGAALEHYSAEVDARPTDGARRLRCTRCLARLGRNDDALEMLTKGLVLNPGSSELLVERTAMLQRLGRWRDVSAAILALAMAHPKHSMLPLLRGRLADALGQPEAAARHFAAGVEANPTDAACRIGWARIERGFGRHNEALKLLAEGLSIAPHMPQLLIERATILREMWRWQEASAAIDALAVAYPSHPNLELLRGQLAEAREDFDKAEPHYAAAVARNRSDISGRLRWVRCLTQLGRYDMAFATLAEGLEVAPAMPDLLVEKVAVLCRAGRWEAASAAIDTLARLHPQHASLHQLRGLLAEMLADHDVAEEHYAADIDANPYDAARRIRWVRSLTRVGRHHEALAVMVERGARSSTERQALGNILLDLGQWADADALLSVWPTDSPREAFARLRFAMQFATARGDHVAAMELAEQILQQRDDDVAAIETLVRSAAFSLNLKRACQVLPRLPGPPAGGGPRQPGIARLRSLTGQVINELRLRSAEMAALSHAPADAKAALAASQVREDAANLGAALWLIGNLKSDSRSSGGRAYIPRMLHQFWDRDPPEDVRALMDRAAGVHCDWWYHRWSEVTALAFLASVPRSDARRAYRQARAGAMRADILRLALLYYIGGVYIDADDFTLSSVDRLLPDGAEVVLYRENLGSIGNDFLAATPGHPLIAEALDRAIQSVLEGAGEAVWLITGPGLMSRVVAAAIARDPMLRLPTGVHVLPTGKLNSCVLRARMLSYKTTSRHWSQSR